MDSQLISSNWPTISIITLLFLILILQKIRKSPKLPPGPWRIPLLGSMHHLIGHIPHVRMREMSQKYGPIMNLQFGETSNIVISSPEAAKQIFKTHDIIFSSRPLMVSAKGVSYNYKDITFAPYGDYWRQLRKICTIELLTVKRVRSFRTIREDETMHLVESISNASSAAGAAASSSTSAAAGAAASSSTSAAAGAAATITTSTSTNSVNFSRLIVYGIYRIVSRAAFRKVWEGEDVFFDCVNRLKMELSRGVSVADAYPSIKWLQRFSSVKARADKHQKPIDQIFQSILDEHRSSRKIGDVDDEKVEDLVDVLLNIQEKGGLQFPLADENIKAMIMDVFVAGTDSTSTAIIWAMVELMRHPEIMAKAQAELRERYGEKGTVDEENLQELSYFSLVIKETLRLHPPTPLLIPRECAEHCVIDGYDIPAKSKVMVNAWAIARDERVWEDAVKFKPERFLDSSRDYKGNDYEYIPFGAGRRICPGILLGVANMELPIAKLLFHFDWKLPDGMIPEDVDITENAVKNDLYIIPIPYLPLTSTN